MTDQAQTVTDICAMDVPLLDRLAAYTRNLRRSGSPFGPAYDDLVDRLAQGQAGAGAPQVGDPMPAFVLPDRSGLMVDLGSLVALGPVVLSFNRGHWCPYCEIELAALADAQPEFAGLGASIVSIMPDRQAFVRRLPEPITDRLTILSDMDNGFAVSIGLGIWIGEAVRRLMREADIRLDRYHGNDDGFLPLPATFVIGADGRIVERFVEADFRRRMEIGTILASLRREAGRRSAGQAS